MNRVPETSEVSPFIIERYQSKYQGCIPAIQVALVVIMATGITLSLLSHFDYLHPAFVYVGAGVSTVSTIIMISILCTRKNHLSKALDGVNTIEELEEILKTTKASSCDFSLYGLGTCCTRYSGADIKFMISSSEIQGSIDDSQLEEFMDKLLDLETNNGTRPITDDKKVIFDRVYKLVNEKCDAYTICSNHFSIPENYLNI